MMDVIYKSPLGRWIMILIQKAGAFRLANRFLRSRLSRIMIPGYIRKHHIDMQDFEGQSYRSFGDFFERTGKKHDYNMNPECLISPCDGLLSCYPITESMKIPMKGSLYRLTDIVPDETVAGDYSGGICLVFRLQASDYHHFCAFDDGIIIKNGFADGELHSVQPIACQSVPVYRLNRRWWSLLDTLHFGKTIQVEIGAMMVGGVQFVKESGWLYRGDAMGNFQLAGSTVLLLLSPEIRKQLKLHPRFHKSLYGEAEVAVQMGEAIGGLQYALEEEDTSGTYAAPACSRRD